MQVAGDHTGRLAQNWDRFSRKFTLAWPRRMVSAAGGAIRACRDQSADHGPDRRIAMGVADHHDQRPGRRRGQCRPGDRGRVRHRQARRDALDARVRHPGTEPPRGRRPPRCSPARPDIQIGAVLPGAVQRPFAGTGPGGTPGPQPGHVLLGPGQPLRGPPAASHRLGEGLAYREVRLLPGVAAEAEQVRAGGGGEHRGLGDAVQIAHGTHFRCV